MKYWLALEGHSFIHSFIHLFISLSCSLGIAGETKEVLGSTTRQQILPREMDLVKEPALVTVTAIISTETERLPKQKWNEPEIDYFQDMQPQIKRTAKVNYKFSNRN